METDLAELLYQPTYECIDVINWIEFRNVKTYAKDGYKHFAIMLKNHPLVVLNLYTKPDNEFKPIENVKYKFLIERYGSVIQEMEIFNSTNANKCFIL